MQRSSIGLLFVVQSVSLGAFWQLVSTQRMSDCKKYPGRKVLKIGAIVPEQIGAKRAYESVMQRVLQDQNKKRPDQFHFTNHFCLEHEMTTLKSPSSPMDNIDAICQHMVPHQVSVILYINPYEEYGDGTASSQYLIHLANNTGIPIIAWNADNSGLLINKDLNDYRILQMAPSLKNQVQAIVELLIRYNWKRFVIVTSEITGNKNFIDECREAADKSRSPHKLEVLEVVSVQARNLSDVRSQLKKVNGEARIFLLYASSEHSDKIFREARIMGLTDKDYLWIVTQSVVEKKGISLERRDKASRHYQTGMLGIHFNTEFQPAETRQNVVSQQIFNGIAVFVTALENMVRSSAILSTNLTSAASCVNDRNYYWQDGGILYKYLKDAESSGISDSGDEFVIAFDNEHAIINDPFISIVNLNEDRYWTEIGQHTKNGLSIRDITWPGKQTSPPIGRPEKYHLKVVTLEEAPFVISGELEQNGQCAAQKVLCRWYSPSSIIPSNKTDEYIMDTNDTAAVMKCCSGFGIDLLNKLAEDLGFDFELYRVEDGKWGAKNLEVTKYCAKTQQWNGLVADIVNNKADMCVTALKINSERQRDIAFSFPFLETGIAIAVAIRKGALSPTAFLEPFDYNTWVLVVLVSIQGAAVSIFLFEWLSPNSYDMKHQPPKGHKFSLFRTYWLVWATLFSASVNTDIPRSQTARFMVLVWAAFALLFHAVYTANLAAFMITRSQFYDISGINDERLNNPKSVTPPFIYGTIESGNTEVTLKRYYSSIHSYMKQNQLFTKTVADGISRLKRGGYHAFIYDAVVLEYLAGRDEDCEILTVGKWFSMTGYGIGMPKNSKWLDKVNNWLLTYQNNGFLERLQNFWFTGACTPKSRDKKGHSVPLGIANFMSAFVLLAAGTVVCLLLLCLEYFYCGYLRKKLSKMSLTQWCTLISMSMAKSLSFSEAAEVVHISCKKSMQHGFKYRSGREKELEAKLNAASNEVAQLQKELDNVRAFQASVQRRQSHPRPELAKQQKQKTKSVDFGAHLNLDLKNHC